MLLSLVPGWGHVYWGREALGIGIFSAAALAGFGFLNTWLVYQGAGTTTLVWVFGVVFCLVIDRTRVVLGNGVASGRTRTLT